MAPSASGPVFWACVLTLVAFAHAQNDIRRPPLISEPNKAETRYFKDKNEVVIKCIADAQPAASYKWMKKGAVIVPNERITFNSQTGDLTFKMFESQDEGEYNCVATSVYDGADSIRRSASSMSPILKLLVTTVERFVEKGVVTVTGSEYNYMTIKCTDKGKVQVETLIYNWYRGDGKDQIGLDNDRLFIDQDGNLHFTYLLAKDTGTKNLHCGIIGDNAIVTGNGNNVIVTSSASPDSAARPQRQHSNSGAKFRLFSDAKLECFFSGYDPVPPSIPTIRWFDDDNKEITAATNPNKYELSDDSRVLTIKNIQETDEKSYYCQAENDGGKSPKEEVRLDIYSQPIFYENKSPADMTKPENEDAIFHCSARSLQNEEKPQAPVWYINSDPFGTHVDITKHVLSADRLTMTIKKLSKMTDIQCIQCSVTNNYGTTWGNGCLNVILAINVLTQPPATQEINHGDVVDLTFTATSDPSETLVYSWMFRNASYQLPPFVTYDDATKTAFINTTDLTEEEYRSIGGKYTRIIHNMHDRKEVITEVVIKDPVVAPVTSKNEFNPWIIGLILGILFLIIVIIIIIFVICRKKQEGDYNVDKKETGAGLDPEKELKEKGFEPYSRPTYDDYEYPEKAPRGDLEYDDVPIGGDDESLGEYGDEADTHFNEDGSFIGVYQTNKNNYQHKSAESTI